MGEQPPVLGHDMVPDTAIAAPVDSEDGNDEDESELPAEQAAAGSDDNEANHRRRRRGRRGGRRRHHGDRDDQGNPLPGANADNRRSPQPRNIEHEQNLATVPVQHDIGDDAVPMPTDEPHGRVPAANVIEPNYFRPSEAAQLSDTSVGPRSQPQQVAVEPAPATEPTDVAPAGPPRRGWWQRLTTRE
jgi:ribonuclease E